MISEALAGQVIAAARIKGTMLATAESCTGGMVSGALTDIAGSSSVFELGFVTYSNNAKISLLGVSPECLQEFGAVSEETAGQMCFGAWRNSTAALTVAITGIAGPGGSDHKPEGRVCFGTCLKGDITTETVEFGPLGRAKVRQAATEHALRLLLAALNG